VSALEKVVRRPVATWMIAIATAVFGLVSYGRLPLNLMPDMAYPTITVRTEVEGYAPEEVEVQISQRIEESLATTPGLVELESRSRAGMSDVVLQFSWGTEMNKAAQSVREQLQTTFLPDDADKPLILRYDPNLDPVMRIALAQTSSDHQGGLDLLGIRHVAENQIKRRLEAMDGVASVRVRGGLEREVQVEVREDWMQARGITIAQVINTLREENVNLPGGAILEGDHEYLVRTVGELLSTTEIANVSIRRSDGIRVPLSEIATISESHKDREVVSRLNGNEAVELEIFKAADANIVRLSEQIRERLGVVERAPEGPGMPRGPPSIKEQIPPGIDLVLLEDQAEFIEASLSNLRSTALLGGILAIVILFLFLRDGRATAIIATAIPLSIICTFAPMYLGGVSLNLMSLGGLALGIGMLVDNAVVVLENIHVHRERGEDRITAAVNGTRDVSAAVVASTLTTVCVFLPITFVEGVAGQLFGDLSMTVVFSLLASLAVALFFVPMLAAQEVSLPEQKPAFKSISRAAQFSSVSQFKEAWSNKRRLLLPYWLLRMMTRLFCEVVAILSVWTTIWLVKPLLWGASRIVPQLQRLAYGAADRFHVHYSKLDTWYSGFITTALNRPSFVLGCTATAVLLSLSMFGNLGQSLIPEMHQGRFTAEISLPVGTPLTRTIDRIDTIEQQLIDDPDIEHLHTVIGTERRADSRPDEGEHTARIMVDLKEGGNLETREEQVMERIRDAVNNTEGVTPEVRMQRPSLFSFRTPIEIIVFDRDLERMRESSDRIVERVSSIDGLTDVRSSLASGYPEVRIDYDRNLLARYGLTTAQVASQVRDKILGKTATTLSRGDGRIDLKVRLDPSDRRGIDQLTRININPELVPSIPLSSVADFRESIGPSEIRRVDQRRAVAISANMSGFDLSGKAAQISQTLEGMKLKSDWELGGQNREMQRSMGSMQMALLLAIFLVYVIMASTFESILHPFVILLSVPLALVGVVTTLFVTKMAVNVVVLIGAIVLSGVVVNNAIVLVDTINQQRDLLGDRVAAIRAGATLRLRPILITTMTTVLGLAPLAMGLGEGSEIQRPLAITIIAGLISATVLTLAVIPVVYLGLTQFLERNRS
jgi:HAE1 family hydrophobic/amphiphilic exporter-1